jgi:hypothetical protein
MNTTVVENVAFMEFELLLVILIMASWGGIIRVLLQKDGLSRENLARRCIAQVIVSCFSGFILSVLGLERGLSSHMIIMMAGLGGAFSGTLLTAAGERIKNIIGGNAVVIK